MGWRSECVKAKHCVVALFLSVDEWVGWLVGWECAGIPIYYDGIFDVLPNIHTHKT